MRLTLVLAIGAVLSLGGCGGESEKGDRAPVSAGGKVTVTLDDYSISPSDLVVARGSTVTASNEGELAHNFTVERGTDPENDAEDLAKTTTFVGGKSDEVRLDLARGRYVTVCTVGNHRELGMVGTLTVK